MKIEFEEYEANELIEGIIVWYHNIMVYIPQYILDWDDAKHVITVDCDGSIYIFKDEKSVVFKEGNVLSNDAYWWTETNYIVQLGVVNPVSYNVAKHSMIKLEDCKTVYED